jgi:hypothetical protein
MLSRDSRFTGKTLSCRSHRNLTIIHKANIRHMKGLADDVEVATKCRRLTKIWLTRSGN